MFRKRSLSVKLVKDPKVEVDEEYVNAFFDRSVQVTASVNNIALNAIKLAIAYKVVDAALTVVVNRLSK